MRTTLNFGYAVRPLSPEEWRLWRMLMKDMIANDKAGNLNRGLNLLTHLRSDGSWKRDLADPAQQSVFVLERESEAVGFAMMITAGGDQTIGVVEGIYVKRDHRGGARVDALMKAGIDWAQAQDKTFFALSHRAANIGMARVADRHGVKMYDHTPGVRWSNGQRDTYIFRALHLKTPAA